MIPGKIFYQSIQYRPQNSPKIKIHLILNSIFYDQIKPFQTKYLCLTSNDCLSVNIQIQQSEQFIGQIQIPNSYKAILQNQTIDIQVNPPKQSKLKSAKLVFHLQPVSSFLRHKLGLTTKQLINLNFLNNDTNQDKNIQQISFNRDPLIQNNSIINQNKEQLLSFKSSRCLNQVLKDNQDDTLQNLASQRQKILGQLFNKFKRKK